MGRWQNNFRLSWLLNMNKDTFLPGFTEQQRDAFLDWYEQRQIELYEEQMNEHIDALSIDDTATHSSATDTSA